MQKIKKKPMTAADMAFLSREAQKKKHGEGYHAEMLRRVECMAVARRKKPVVDKSQDNVEKPMK
jgi:hypothetical protein